MEQHPVISEARLCIQDITNNRKLLAHHEGLHYQWWLSWAKSDAATVQPLRCYSRAQSWMSGNALLPYITHSLPGYVPPMGEYNAVYPDAMMQAKTG